MHEAHQDPQNESHNHWFCMCVSIVNIHMAFKKKIGLNFLNKR